MNFSPLPFTINSWVTCQSKFNVFVTWIWKFYSTDVPRTSLEHLIIWSWGHPATESCRRPVEIPVWNFWIFVLSVKIRNRYVIQALLLLKTISSLNHQFWYWFHESSLKDPSRSQALRPLRDVPGRSCAGWVVPFFKNIYMSRSAISSSSIFVILSTASQLKPGALK